LETTKLGARLDSGNDSALRSFLSKLTGLPKLTVPSDILDRTRDGFAMKAKI